MIFVYTLDLSFFFYTSLNRAEVASFSFTVVNFEINLEGKKPILFQNSLIKYKRVHNRCWRFTIILGKQKYLRHLGAR